jgi:hypothetical protein
VSVLVLAGAPASRAAVCSPAACPASFHHVDFETLAPGTSVEGPGSVDAHLTITSVAWPLGLSCPAGSARVVEEGNTFPYDAWSTNTSVENGCLNGARGFTDNEQCVLDYDFTFAPGVTVGCFGIRIVDYGDYFPFGGTDHDVTLTAYDALDNIVDQDLLHMTGGVDLAAGDACTSQAGAGNILLTVAGPGIVKVTLRYDAFADPNVGYDDIAFCELTGPTPVRSRSWGTLKTTYR